jgi:hypothetical protein
MSLPGYVAETAIGRPVGAYRGMSVPNAVGSDQLLIPSLFSYQNIGWPLTLGIPGMTIQETLGELGVGGGSCLLGCGESRADCFRTCNRPSSECREICDTVDQSCQMDCFFGSGVNIA